MDGSEQELKVFIARIYINFNFNLILAYCCFIIIEVESNNNTMSYIDL